MEDICQTVLDISMSANIINEILDAIKVHENICATIIKKARWSIRDEIDYDNSIAVLDRCDRQLELLGYYDSPN